MRSNFFTAIVLFLVAAIGSSCESKGTAQPKTEKERPVVSTECAATSLTIVLDKTQSESDAPLPSFSAELEAVFPECGELADIRVLSIGLNGDPSPFKAILQKFDLPLGKFAQFDEAGARVRAEKLCGFREPCKVREIEEARRSYNASVDELVSKHDENFRKVLLEIRSAILQKAQSESSYTDLDAQGTRIEMLTTPHVIWLSDLQHTLSTPVKNREFKEKHVLIGLLPLKDEAPQGFEKRLAAAQSRYHGNVDIRSAADIDKRAISDFLRRK